MSHSLPRPPFLPHPHSSTCCLFLECWILLVGEISIFADDKNGSARIKHQEPILHLENSHLQLVIQRPTILKQMQPSYPRSDFSPYSDAKKGFLLHTTLGVMVWSGNSNTREIKFEASQDYEAWCFAKRKGRRAGLESVGKAPATQPEDLGSEPHGHVKQDSVTHTSLSLWEDKSRRQGSLWKPQVQLARCMSLRKKEKILKVALWPPCTCCSMYVHTCMHTCAAYTQE